MFLLELLKSILFGIVEGVTEWLPVSSTGHLILLNELLTLHVSDEFYEMFQVVIQLGAILAVLLKYRKKLSPFSKDPSERNRGIRLWLRIAVATLPSAVIGLLFDELLDKYLYNSFTVSTMLLIWGVGFILAEKFHNKKDPRLADTDSVSYIDALRVGAFQVFSLIPGTSRSGATILGATLLGFSRSAAAEFSFFLAIPTMLGAGVLKTTKFLAEGNQCSAEELVLLGVGAAVAFAVSCGVIDFLTDYVKKHGFVAFGIYRIVLSGAVMLCECIR